LIHLIYCFAFGFFLCLGQKQSSGKSTHPLGQHYLVSKAFLFSSFPLSIPTSRGLSITFSFRLSFPIGSPSSPPWVTLVTPKCRTYIEVTLGVVSYSYNTCFVVGLGFSQLTTCAITLPLKLCEGIVVTLYFPQHYRNYANITW